jgi:hypothetical protein
MDLEYQYFVFEIMVLGVIFIGLAYLLALSMIVRDYKLIVERPFIFIIELLLMSLLPGIPILFFVVSRGTTLTQAWVWFVSLSAKFAIFHVLSQLSGFYTWIFS